MYYKKYIKYKYKYNNIKFGGTIDDNYDENIDDFQEGN
jgi:hypothetical protein